jgi:hypothetical protein
VFGNKKNKLLGSGQFSAMNKHGHKTADSINCKEMADYTCRLPNTILSHEFACHKQVEKMQVRRY